MMNICIYAYVFIFSWLNKIFHSWYIASHMHILMHSFIINLRVSREDAISSWVLVSIILNTCHGALRSGVLCTGHDSPVSQLFSPSGEQPGQRILAHKSEQTTAGYLTIFHKFCCFIKRVGITTNLTLWNPWSYIPNMSKYHNAGIWSMGCNLWRFRLKTHNTSGNLF